MVPQSPRHNHSAKCARRKRADKFGLLQCELLEGRISPALFNVISPQSFSGLNNNGCVAVADLNKDGLADAVLTNFGTDYGAGAGSTITVLYGKSGGGFNKIQLNTNGKNVAFASIADINGDGWDDVVVANANQQNTGSISVFKNDGAGNLSLVGTPFSTFSNNASWVGLADVTGDGVLDAIVGSFGKDDGSGNNITGNNVTIFQGNADGQGHGDFTFSGSPITTLAPEIQFIPTALAVADFNGDGIMDIAAAVPGVPADSGQPQPSGTVYLFQGTGSGGFSAPNQFDSGGALPVNIQAADVNGDGKKDLVIANVGDPNGSSEFVNNSVGVMLNVSSTSSINFGVTNSLTANCHGTFAVAVADFDLNGHADIASVNYGAQLSSSPAAFVSLYMGDGTGTFSAGSPATYDTQTNFGGGQYLAVGDFDGNGTPDLIVAHATNLVGVLINTSTPPVSTTTTLESSVNPSTAGQSVTFTATVTAATGTAAGGTVTFFDNGVAMGNSVNLTNHQAQFTTTTLSVGTHSITATYSGAPGFGGSTSDPLSQVVTNGSTTNFTFSGLPTTITAGTSFDFTLTARDQSGNVATDYLGTVHFTSSDGKAVLPGNYAFTAGDSGSHTFTVTLGTAGVQSITATDTVTSSITGTGSTTVKAAAASTFTVAGYPSTTSAGVAHSFTVTAKDAFGNTADSYTGTVHFTSSDPLATLSGDYTFVSGDKGVHAFSATLNTEGTQSITATDTVSTSITGSQSNITVTGGGGGGTTSPTFGVGSVHGLVGRVVVYNPDRSIKYNSTPFGATYNRAMPNATGDVTGDGVADVVAIKSGIPAQHKRARVAVVDGSTDTVMSTPSINLGRYTGAVSVAVGDLTGDGIADIVLGLNQNGSRFLVFRGGDLALIAAFRVGTGNGFLGRTSVAIGDLDGNGRDDLIVSALYGNRTRVAGFNGESFDPGATRTRMFSAFALGGKYTKGAYLAAGDVNGDGKADVVLGSTSAVVVKAFSGADLTESNIHTRIAAFGPLGGVSKGGVRVAVRDLNGDGVGDIITASGELVSAFAGGVNLPPAGTPSLLFAFDPEPTTLGGAWVG